jgi:hypothetical protein
MLQYGRVNLVTTDESAAALPIYSVSAARIQDKHAATLRRIWTHNPTVLYRSLPRTWSKPFHGYLIYRLTPGTEHLHYPSVSRQTANAAGNRQGKAAASAFAVFGE